MNEILSRLSYSSSKNSLLNNSNIIHTSITILAALQIMTNTIQTLILEENPSNFRSIIQIVSNIVNVGSILQILDTQLIFCGLVCYIIFLSIDIFKIKNRKYSSGSLMTSVCFVSPIAIKILSVHLATCQQYSIQMYISGILLSIFSLIWILHRSLLYQCASDFAFRVNRSMSIIRIFAYMGQNYLFAFQYHKTNTMYFLYIILAIQFFLFIIRIMVSEFLSEQLEYVTLLGNLANIGLIGISLLRYGQIDQIFIAYCIVIYAIYQSNVLNNFMRSKYLFIFKNFRDQLSPEHTLALVHLVNHRQKSKIFDLGLKEFLDLVYHQMAYINWKEIDARIIQEFSSYRTCISNYLSLKLKNLNNFNLNIYLMGLYLEHGQYLKFVKYFSLLEICEKFKKGVQLGLLRMEGNHYLKVCRDLKIPSESIGKTLECVYTKLTETINIENIIKSQVIFSKLLKMINNLLQKKGDLTRMLLVGQHLSSKRLEQTMYGLSKKKDQVWNYLQKHKRTLNQKKFTVLAYIFMKYCCKIQYAIKNFMEQYIKLPQSNIYPTKTTGTMVALVSGDQDSLGTIINADINMREYFHLSYDKIQNKSQRIDAFMPSSIAKKHNSFINRFKQTGQPTIIGRHVSLIAIKNNQPQPIRLIVRVMPNFDGLMFSALMEIQKVNIGLILFDYDGTIREYNKILSRYIPHLSKMKDIQNVLRLRNHDDEQTYSRNSISKRNSSILREQLIFDFSYQYGAFKLKVHIDYLKARDNLFGICKIPLPKLREKALLIQSQNTIDSNVFLLSGFQASQRVVYQYAQVQKQLHYTYHHNPTLLTKSNIPLLTSLLLPIIFMLIVNMQFLKCFDHADSIARFCQQITTDIKTFPMEMSIHLQFIRLMNMGILKTDALSDRFSVSMSEYLNFSLVQERDIDDFNNNLFAFQGSIGGAFSLINDRIISLQSLDIQISFVELISYLQSYYIEEIAQPQDIIKNQQQFLKKLNRWIASQNLIIDKQIYQPLMKNILTSLLLSSTILKNLAGGMFCAMVLSFGLTIWIICSRKKEEQQYLNLLINFKSQRLSQHEKTICEVLQFLNELRDHKIKAFKFTGELTSVMCLVEHCKPLVGRTQKALSLDITKKSFSTKTKLKKQTFVHHDCGIFAVLALCFLAFLLQGFAIIDAENITVSSVNIYFHILTESSSIQDAEVQMLNIILKTISEGGELPSTANQTESWEHYQNIIMMRKIQDILKGYFDWPLVKDLLYTELCNNSTDPTCAMHLSGALHRGIAASTSQFSKQLTQIYLLIQLDYNHYINKIQTQLCDLYLVYRHYIIPNFIELNKHIFYHFQKAISDISDKLELTLYYLYIPLITLSTIAAFVITYKSMIKMHQIKIQVLSLESVDFSMNKGSNISYDLYRLLTNFLNTYSKSFLV